MPKSHQPEGKGYTTLTELKGGPRGLLLYYVLHSISIKPRHGYEILQDIDSKTEGAWRPGVGSVYPILKKLLNRGYVRADAPGEAENRKVYSITEQGQEMAKQLGDVFAGSYQRWMAMRRLYFDLLDPAGVCNMFVEASRKQFEMARELFDSRRDSLPRSEVDFMLREYSVNLERQLEWTHNRLGDMRQKAVVPGKARLR